LGWLQKKGVPTAALPLEARAVRLLAQEIREFREGGILLNKGQYERGMDAAPLGDEILMLPLNFIGMGTPRAAAQAAKVGVRIVAKEAVAATGQVAKKELGIIARNFPRVNAVADRVIHGGLSRRDEFNLEGPVEAKVVEEVFAREGLVWRLRVNGRVIETTAEHPFFVAGREWVPCHELQVGDRIATESGAWVAVEAVEDTGEWKTVYNLRVADHHTYFVGCQEWGFSVWAHNTYTGAMNREQAVATLRAAGLKRKQAMQIAELAERPGIQGNQLIADVARDVASAKQSLTWSEVRGGFGREAHLNNLAARYADNVNVRPASSPHYSVVTQVELPPHLHVAKDYAHFQAANGLLHQRMVANPEFAAMLEQMYPGLTKAITPSKVGGKYPGTSPSEVGLTWNHLTTRAGVLELIPTAHHTAAGPVQQTLNPGGRGGKAVWGGGRPRGPKTPTGPTLFDDIP
jgi:hypothetical protein